MIQREFGTLPDGRIVHVFELANRSGLEIRIMDYGGIVLSLLVPDRDGLLTDVVLGFDDLDSYLGQTSYFGAIIGRYCNRISQASFAIDGQRYPLPANDGRNHLHGGWRGFHEVLWTADESSYHAGGELILRHRSADGDEGYPGNLNVEVAYRLNDSNELIVDYRATTDKSTVVNLTHHSYFNLAGVGDILDHELWIGADFLTTVDSSLIPTGELQPVAGTPFDFTTPRAIGSRIDETDEQLHFGDGYDHNFVLARQGPDGSQSPVPVARVSDPSSGRVLEVETTEPGLHLFSGNSLSPAIVGKCGEPYRRHGGFCLETQHFPDSPNQPRFPSTLLRPGEEYSSRTTYRFAVDRIAL